MLLINIKSNAQFIVVQCVKYFSFPFFIVLSFKCLSFFSFLGRKNDFYFIVYHDLKCIILYIQILKITHIFLQFYKTKFFLYFYAGKINILNFIANRDLGC